MADSTLSVFSALSFFCARAMALALAVLSWPMARMASGDAGLETHPWIFISMLALGLSVAAAIWIACACAKRF